MKKVSSLNGAQWDRTEIVPEKIGLYMKIILPFSCSDQLFWGPNEIGDHFGYSQRLSFIDSAAYKSN